MDWIRIHATINECPAAAVGVGTGLLLISTLVGGRRLQKAAFRLFLVASVIAMLAFVSGAPAEIALHDAPGMSKALVEQHRYAARLAVSVTVVLGLIGIAAIKSMRDERALSRAFMVVGLVASLAAVISTGWAVYSGIRVRGAEVQAQYLPHNRPDVN